MQSVENIPPPISQLLTCTVDDDFNIEEGLCRPNNDDLFLISSIAFLQKQLERKLGKNDGVVEEKTHRKYSNLLMVESGTKTKREKYFIRLANIEKFDEVLKREASLPAKTLSNTQILPLPKARSHRTLFPNIFKTKFSTSIIQNPKSTHSLFNVFKKSHTKICAEASIENNMDRNKGPVVNANERKFICPSTCSLSSVSFLRPSTASTGITKCKSSNISIPTVSTSASSPEFNSVSRASRSTSYISTKTKLLTQAEKEILRIIPSESSVAIKKSIDQNLRASLPVTSSESNISQATINFILSDDYYEDPETGIKFKCVPKSTTCIKPTRLREQQSKLSVCIEEETESEMEMYSSTNPGYPYNCTDDIKTMVPSETLNVIVRQLLNKIESN